MSGEQCRTVHIEALTRDGFAAFGTVVELPESGGRLANDGTALRFDDTAQLVPNAAGGRPQMSLMRVTPIPLPMICCKLERHPRSSQLFMPFPCRPFLVVVAPGETGPDLKRLRAFMTNGAQGVNYAPGTWHHAALAVAVPTGFLVIGHASEIGDCDIADLTDKQAITIASR